MIKERILDNWKTDIIGYAQSIIDLESTDYPAWTVRFDDSYGVAIPYTGDDVISESFANARIRSTIIHFQEGNAQKALVLTSDNDRIRDQFAVLCEALVDPGEDGSKRISIDSSPVMWWSEWKELLGNKNIDERVYDVLGELCVLRYAVLNGEEAEWTGPDGATYDLEAPERFLEVKSSTVRDRREVTISSQFQLFPQGKPLDLVLCRFEPTIMTGESIDGVLNDFQSMGYNVDLLNRKLEMRGFERGMSARKKTFRILEMLLYRVDKSFPRITPESFVGGTMPKGITKLNYTVDLSTIEPTTVIKRCDDEV